VEDSHFQRWDLNPPLRNPPSSSNSVKARTVELVLLLLRVPLLPLQVLLTLLVLPLLLLRLLLYLPQLKLILVAYLLSHCEYYSRNLVVHSFSRFPSQRLAERSIRKLYSLQMPSITRSTSSWLSLRRQQQELHRIHQLNRNLLHLEQFRRDFRLLEVQE